MASSAGLLRRAVASTAWSAPPARRSVQPGGLHGDHACHWVAGEVHFPDVVGFQGPLGGLVAKPDHELVPKTPANMCPPSRNGRPPKILRSVTSASPGSAAR